MAKKTCYYDYSVPDKQRIAIVTWDDVDAIDLRFGKPLHVNELPNNFHMWRTYQRGGYGDCTLVVKSEHGN